MKYRTTALLASILLLALPAAWSGEAPKPPFPYVWGKAYHILPETHNNESGYFSLCEGLDGCLYVGTAKYGVNSYLVQFDPRTEQQKIVIDTHQLCGLTGTGYAAQAKIHTRNFVGPSGKIYVGSMQGHQQPGETEAYPGGYLMTYDPRTGKAECLGMPSPGAGVIDVVADEARGILYASTMPGGHWMRSDLKGKAYRELGPKLVAFASTLIDRKGRANALTKDFELSQYDPPTDKLSVRPIRLGETTLKNPNVPEWRLAPDGRHAYFIQLDDPTLIQVDLESEGEVVAARSFGKLIEGQGYDSRGALSFGPDGKLYAVVRVSNETGFGDGYLHHLLRFDPATQKIDDLGVLAVKNPDFFNFGPDAAGNRPPWSHGFHTLPDGTLTPMHVHLAMIVARDNSVYVTILYPFTLLKVDQFRSTK